MLFVFQIQNTTFAITMFGCGKSDTTNKYVCMYVTPTVLNVYRYLAIYYVIALY